jgi:hypothetical protein
MHRRYETFWCEIANARKVLNPPGVSNFKGRDFISRPKLTVMPSFSNPGLQPGGTSYFIQTDTEPFPAPIC